jgi:hypothetical protein
VPSTRALEGERCDGVRFRLSKIMSNVTHFFLCSYSSACVQKASLSALALVLLWAIVQEHPRLVPHPNSLTRVVRFAMMEGCQIFPSQVYSDALLASMIYMTPQTNEETSLVFWTLELRWNFVLPSSVSLASSTPERYYHTPQPE